MKKILIVDKIHPYFVENIDTSRFTVDYKPDIKREEILSLISDYHILVIRSKTTIDEELIHTAEKLELIARAGAGLDLLDLELLKRNKVHIVNAPEGNRDAVGEHTLGMLLCLFHKLNLGNFQIRNGIWDREGNRGVELKGKTVGIIGYGNMGKAFAQRLAGFQCKVIAYDKYAVSYEDLFAKKVELDSIFEESDILSLHTPLTDETRGMVTESFLNKFKKPIYLINVSRGEVVGVEVINNALKTGRLKGAVLDVLENEKLNKLNEQQKNEYSRLMKKDNVILSPHVAGWTFESYENISKVLLKKVECFYEK